MFLKSLVKKIIWRINGVNFIANQQCQIRRELDALAQKQNELYQASRFHDSIIDNPWLRYKSFSLGGWAADYGLMHTLFGTLNTMKPDNILEFGLGQTSKMIHQYAKFYNVNAITCEHDNKWIEFFNNGKDGDYPIEIQLMDLQTVQYKGYNVLTYKDCSKVLGNQQFDLIVVDGPFGSEHFSRSQIVDIAKNNLAKQFCIIIDDCERLGEQETIEEVRSILRANQVDFSERVYSAEKQHMLICSSSLKFLTSM